MNDRNRGLPKVTPMPTPPRPPEPPRRNNSEAVYAEEALRVAQRHLDQVDEINRLGIELDDWRRRALMAEAEIKRLEKRAADLEGALERQQDKLMTERDGYRERLLAYDSPEGGATAGGGATAEGGWRRRASRRRRCGSRRMGVRCRAGRESWPARQVGVGVLAVC